MRQALAEPGHLHASDLSAVAMHASSFLLRRAVAGAASREATLDLLAADALMTYACEAAADNPESVEARATGMVEFLLRDPEERVADRTGETG